MIEDIAALIPAYNPDREMTKVVGELVNEFSNIVIVDDGCDESYGEIFAEVMNLEFVDDTLYVISNDSQGYSEEYGGNVTLMDETYHICAYKDDLIFEAPGS